MIDDEQIAARTEAAKRLGWARGRRDAALETGARLARALLQEDRDALIAGHRIHADDIAADEVVMDGAWAQRRLDAYDQAIAQIALAFGELQQAVDRRDAEYRTLAGLPPHPDTAG